MEKKKNDELELEVSKSKALSPGDAHYRAYVGPPDQYDFMGATQFRLATSLGLREDSYLLDIGCGSLRAGKFMIQYLLSGRYFGIEPNDWLWKEAIEKEIGRDILKIKCPTFSTNEYFEFSLFGQKFDFIIAQSIFSHTGQDLFSQGISSIRNVMEVDGQFLFTLLSEETIDFETITKGSDVLGWVYPDCVTYSEEQVESIFKFNNLYLQKLHWFHPRQRWYRAVRNPEYLIHSPDNDLDSGRVLFDPRFS